VSAAIALGIAAAIVGGTMLFGLWGVRRVRMSPQEFIVGGRSFGTVFIWLLMAGEVYTTFTFLGAAGWAYTRGAPAFYILCYGPLAYIIAFFLTPPIWRVARRRQLLTGPDFLGAQYGSKALAGLVALAGFVFLIPYVTLQLSGLEILLHLAGYSRLDARLAAGIAFAVMAIFVHLVGLRGTAWASVVKDVLMLGAVMFAGIVLPTHFFGSPARVVSRVLEQHPGWMTLHGAATPNGMLWFISTIVLSGLGFFMFPQTMAAVYSARSEDTLRRNAVFLPFYQLMVLLVYFGGFTALLLIPGLKGQAGDQSFLLVVQKYYPPWLLGLVAGAGCLAGLVPASAQILAAASIVAKNLLVDYRLVKSDAGAMAATRVLVLAVATLAFTFWFFARQTLVGLLIVSYTGIAQLFPGVALSFAQRLRPNAAGVGAGIVTGIAGLAVFAARGQDSWHGVNSGMVALFLNVLVLGAATGAGRILGRTPIPSEAKGQASPEQEIAEPE
jgi:SSS family solute:Na+ symporter